MTPDQADEVIRLLRDILEELQLARQQAKPPQAANVRRDVLHPPKGG